MPLSAPRRLLLGSGALALALLTGCTEGEDTSASGFSGGSFTASQASQTNPTMQTSADTGATTEATATTGEPTSSTTGQPVTATEASGTTTDDPSAGTTTDPATTDPVTSDPSTTGVDPSTTTGVDPSTTTTGMTTMEDTTGEPMMPPTKDPQPANGLYEPCADNTPCEPALTDGCFTITDGMTMQIIDGYCTIVCTKLADCGPAPKAPAVQECLNIAANQNVCALKCTGVADCPTGMACTSLSLPNNATGKYCT